MRVQFAAAPHYMHRDYQKACPHTSTRLPGLYILSEVKELGTHCFFHLIKPSVIEGGKILEKG